jgi:hypothetical protein
MNSKNPVVSVIKPPRRVDGGICRVVELADGKGSVESWINGAWVPGGATLKEVAMGTPCADPEHYAKGIAFARNAPLSPLEKAMQRNVLKRRVVRAVLELLEGPWTRTALIILVLGIATLLYLCITH